MKRVIIFGASGFVGRYLSQEFLNHGYEVFGSDINQATVLPDRVKFIGADILDGREVENTVNKICPDIIVNLAAVSSVGASWNIPQTTISVNVIGALNIMEAARKCAFSPRILLVGSSEEYMVSNLPIAEDTPLNASNPYGISKVAQEQFARLYQEQYGLKIYYVRPFNHTGIGQKDSFVLPSFCKQIVEIEKTGRPGVLKTGNLNVTRDFSHVKDIVRAYRMIVESSNFKMVYNVGAGKAYSLKTLLEYVVGLSKQKVMIEMDQTRCRPTDYPTICCDCTLIKDNLGWKPEYTVFDALREMVDYYRNENG